MSTRMLTNHLKIFMIISDEEGPLNLSLKGNTRNHNIWSPGSLCEQETKSLINIRPNSSLGGSNFSPGESRWKCYSPEKDTVSSKLPTVLSTGDKTFTVRFQAILVI